MQPSRINTTPDERLLRDMTAYELIARLDVVYPHTCLPKGGTLEDAQRYAGARDVIDQLLQEMNEEKDDDAGDEDPTGA